MQERSSRLSFRLGAYACSVACLVVVCFVPTASAGWMVESRDLQTATTIPLASTETIAPITHAQESGDTGDSIRQRFYSTLVATAFLTACSLLLLGAYVTFRDPLRKRWTEMRMRELRRRERRSRHRKS